MKRNVLIALGVALILAAGVLAYIKFRPGSAQAQPDPAVQIAVTLGALERSESHRLTTDQIKTILPLLRVLRDTDPNDVEASRALAQAVRDVLTPDQLAELDRLRAEAQARRDQAGGPEPQGPRRSPRAPGVGGPGFGQGGANPQGRVDLRARARQALLSRLIRFLERQI